MNKYNNYTEPQKDYAAMLLDLLKSRIVRKSETYGFEFEFLSANPIDLKTMGEIYDFLPNAGFTEEKGSYIHESGLFINFEPGGQIEYHSPPLTVKDHETFRNYLALIEETNLTIKKKLNIDYLGKGFLPGRKDAPLCLDTKRYTDLHTRLSSSGTRGLEMMKGTASIHFHVGIKNMNEIPHIFKSLIDVSRMDEFKMSEERRDIWNNTDPSRCGQPFFFNDSSSAEEVIGRIVDHALKADHISENKPFLFTSDLSFEAFMYHLTTIFTDIRLNIKGPSIEVRTTDSVPIDQFEIKWNRFISIFSEKKETR